MIAVDLVVIAAAEVVEAVAVVPLEVDVVAVVVARGRRRSKGRCQSHCCTSRLPPLS